MCSIPLLWFSLVFLFLQAAISTKLVPKVLIVVYEDHLLVYKERLHVPVCVYVFVFNNFGPHPDFLWLIFFFFQVFTQYSLFFHHMCCCLSPSNRCFYSELALQTPKPDFHCNPTAIVLQQSQTFTNQTVRRRFCILYKLEMYCSTSQE